MTEYDEPQDADIWGYMCRLTTAQINEFRLYAKRSELEKKWRRLDQEQDAHIAVGNAKQAGRISEEMFVLDHKMFLEAVEWHKRQLNAVPDTMPDDM